MTANPTITISAKAECVKCHATYDMTVFVRDLLLGDVRNRLTTVDPLVYRRCLVCNQDGLLLTGTVDMPFA
jgi:hypothetical protein